LTQKFVLELSEEDSKTLVRLLQEAKQLLTLETQLTSTQETKPEIPLKRDDILLEFNLKGSTFYNLQRRGIITPHRMAGSRLTYYYRSEVLAALKRFNPGKYAR
jgi:hypothetical protein